MRQRLSIGAYDIFYQKCYSKKAFFSSLSRCGQNKKNFPLPLYRVFSPGLECFLSRCRVFSPYSIAETRKPELTTAILVENNAVL